MRLFYALLSLVSQFIFPCSALHVFALYLWLWIYLGWPCQLVLWPTGDYGLCLNNMNVEFIPLHRTHFYQVTCFIQRFPQCYSENLQFIFPASSITLKMMTPIYQVHLWQHPQAHWSHINMRTPDDKFLPTWNYAYYFTGHGSTTVCLLNQTICWRLFNIWSFLTALHDAYASLTLAEHLTRYSGVGFFFCHF